MLMETSSASSLLWLVIRAVTCWVNSSGSHQKGVLGCPHNIALMVTQVPASRKNPLSSVFPSLWFYSRAFLLTSLRNSPLALPCSSFSPNPFPLVFPTLFSVHNLTMNLLDCPAFCPFPLVSLGLFNSLPFSRWFNWGLKKGRWSQMKFFFLSVECGGWGRAKNPRGSRGDQTCFAARGRGVVRIGGWGCKHGPFSTVLQFSARHL